MTRTTVRDGRQMPFFQVIKDDIRVIERACASPKVRVKLSAVRSTYFALLEFANDDRAEETNVSRQALADRAGLSARTCQEATAVLEGAGLLRVTEIRGAGSSGNVWTLTDSPNRQPLPVQTGNHCRPNRQPLPVPIETVQEGEENPPSPQPDVELVFEHWRKLIAPRAVLDDARRRVIVKALKIATQAECLKAITGISTSDFHMARGEHKGQNKQSHLSLVLRDREHIDRYMAMAPGEPGGVVSSAHRERIRQAKMNVLTAHDLSHSESAQREGERSERWLADNGIRVVRTADSRPKFEESEAA